MPVALKKIIAVFIIVAMLPLAYVIYELSSLNSNEEAISEIYADQLEAILFSVNQYSADIITSWASEVSTIHNHTHLSRYQKIQDVEQVITKFPSLLTAYFPARKDKVSWMYGTKSDSLKSKLDSMLNSEIEKIQKLIEYKKGGYFKMELLDTTFFENHVPILFAHDTLDPSESVGVILVEVENFVKHDVGPKIQGIASDQFVITAWQGNDLIHSSDLDYSIYQKKEGKVLETRFWLLPDYKLKIRAKGRSIEQIVKKRRNDTLIVLAMLMVALLLSMSILFSSIKREVYLSQAKSEFVSNVSHELRTPLSLISMFAETLALGRVKNEKKKKEYYGIIGKETSRLSKIVNGILSFSQIDAKKRDYHLKRSISTKWWRKFGAITSLSLMNKTLRMAPS